ncbi:MAG: hypothetical protein HOY79_13855 [Streptomyces sp.]|nr:hypothetical protein [Streptomyces sp.]
MSVPRKRWGRPLLRRCLRPLASAMVLLVLLAVGVTLVAVQLRTETGYVILALAWSAALLAAWTRLALRRTAQRIGAPRDR